MKDTTLTTPEVGFIALTRVVLGIGIGLLVSCALSPEQRKILGAALIGAGAVTTIPIAMKMLGKECEPQRRVELVA